MTEYTGAFRRNYGPLQGHDWIRRLDTEARRIFVQMGNQFNEHGHRGGVARARTAQRDQRGRFVSANPIRWIQIREECYQNLEQETTEETTREETVRQPYHAKRITMLFDRKAHILDVAYEAVSVARLTMCDVGMELDGWKFDVTPHMDVPEVVEAYQKQPGWFVEPVESVAAQEAALDEEPLVSEMKAKNVQPA